MISRLLAAGLTSVIMGTSGLDGSASSSSSSAPPVTPSVQSCEAAVTTDLNALHQQYRQYLFGSDMVLSGSGDIIVNDKGDHHPVYPGVLRSRGRLTSELIGPALEGYRTYACASRLYCKLMENSFTHSPDEKITVTVDLLGCPSLLRSPIYPACALASEKAEATVADTATLRAYCADVVEQTLTHERAALKVAFAYDANYRGTLQFAGMVQAMLADIPRLLFAPLKQAVGLLGGFSKIPCFIGQCDVPDPSKIR